MATRTLLVALSILTLGVAGCGSTNEDGAGGAGGSGGSGGMSGASGSGGTSGSSGAAGSSGASCIVQAGKWNVQYSGGGGAPPEADVLNIDAKGAVTFERISPPDGCIPGGGPGKVTMNEGTLNAKCALTATWAASYCYSGESQSLKRELSLLFVGNASADGMMTLTQGSAGGGSYTTSYTAKATSAP